MYFIMFDSEIGNVKFNTNQTTLEHLKLIWTSIVQTLALTVDERFIFYKSLARPS